MSRTSLRKLAATVGLSLLVGGAVSAQSRYESCAALGTSKGNPEFNNSDCSSYMPMSSVSMNVRFSGECTTPNGFDFDSLMFSFLFTDAANSPAYVSANGLCLAYVLVATGESGFANCATADSLCKKGYFHNVDYSLSPPLFWQGNRNYSGDISCEHSCLVAFVESCSGDYPVCDEGTVAGCKPDGTWTCCSANNAVTLPDGTLRCPAGESPVILDIEGDGFSLTSAEQGVRFDLNYDGVREKIAWTARGSDDAFVVLDRNGNGGIDDGSEMFGDHTPQPPSPAPNGFLALSEYDKPANGGNGDGKIDSQDRVFVSLRLWQDTDHNGVSDPRELRTLPSLGLVSIDLDYRDTRWRDDYGNDFRYRSRVRSDRDSNVGRWAYDVFLVRGR